MPSETEGPFAALREHYTNGPAAERALATLEGLARTTDDPRGLLAALLGRLPTVTHAPHQTALLRLALRLAVTLGEVPRAVEALDVPACRYTLTTGVHALLEGEPELRPAIGVLLARRSGFERGAFLDGALRARPAEAAETLAAAARAGVSSYDQCRALRNASYASEAALAPARVWLVNALRERHGASDDKTREEAVGLLAMRVFAEDEEAQAALALALDDRAPAVAKRAARVHADRSARAGLDALDALLCDARPGVRAAAACALVTPGLPDALAHARAIATLGDEDPRVRAEAASAALSLAAARAAGRPLEPALLDAARSLREPLRARPLDALDALGAEALCVLAATHTESAALLDALAPCEPSPAPFARLCAWLERAAQGRGSYECRACAQLGRSNGSFDPSVAAAAKALQPPLPQGDVSAFLLRCASCDAPYRYDRATELDVNSEHVSVSLVRITRVAALALLDADAREASRAQLGALVERWREELAHPRRWVRRDAAWNLCAVARAAGRFDEHAALLAHPDAHVRAEVATGLLEDRPQPSTPALDRALDAAAAYEPRDAHDAYGEARSAAARLVAMSALERGEFELVVEGARAEHDAGRRCAALEALRFPRRTEVLGRAHRIVALLASPDERTRYAASDLLQDSAQEKLLAPDALPELCAILRDAGPEVAPWALRVLSHVSIRHDEVPALAARWYADPKAAHGAVGALGAQARAGAPLDAQLALLGEALTVSGLEDSALHALRAVYDRARDPIPAVRALLRGARGGWASSVSAELLRLSEKGTDLGPLEDELRELLAGAGPYERDVLVRALLRIAARGGDDERVRRWVAHPDDELASIAIGEAEALRIDPARFAAALDRARVSAYAYLRDNAARWAKGARPAR